MGKCEEENMIETNGTLNTSRLSISSGRKSPVSKSKHNGDYKPRLNMPTEHVPPDGGAKAWLVMFSSFVCNGILFGVINSYGVVYVELKQQLTDAGVEDAAGKGALVGSLTIGTTFLLSPVAGILTDLIGIRWTSFLGGFIATTGMAISSFYTHKVEVLYITYGIMFGAGASLAYTPSLAVLGHYFKKYLGIVNGFVTAGSSLFTIVMPVILDTLIKSSGLAQSLRFMAGVVALIMASSILYVPLYNAAEERESKKGQVLNHDIWKEKRYVIWVISVPLALFGYFVPYVHVKEFVHNKYPGSNGNLPVMCIGITSGIGRILFGFITDRPGMNRVVMQQVSFACIGICTMILPSTNDFNIFLVLILVMGLFDGGFISMLGPIAYDFCGSAGATQAIGFLLGFCSIPLTIGPPVAGMIFDRTGSYTWPFILAGIPPLLGATALCLVRCVRTPDNRLSGGQDMASIPLTLKTNQIKLSMSYKETKCASAESLSDALRDTKETT